MFYQFVTAALLFSVAVFAAAGLDTQKIETLTGLKGQFNEKENVFKISFPRKDLSVSIKGVHVTPPMGLTAWAAFTPTGDHVSVMGDIVMTEDQVNSVMSAALDAGLDVTALHNHFFYDSPKVMFMHIGGMGPEEQVAKSVGVVFSKLQETMKQKPTFPEAKIEPEKGKLDTKKIDDILVNHGDLNSGVYKLTWGKKTKMSGHEMAGAMGVNTWAAFAGSDKKAIVDGDFAMFEGELKGVLKALRSHDINVVAIHNHMTEENPRIIFLHYWGVGPTDKLATALKSALDTQK